MSDLNSKIEAAKNEVRALQIGHYLLTDLLRSESKATWKCAHSLLLTMAQKVLTAKEGGGGSWSYSVQLLYSFEPYNTENGSLKSLFSYWDSVPRDSFDS